MEEVEGLWMVRGWYAQVLTQMQQVLPLPFLFGLVGVVRGRKRQRKAYNIQVLADLEARGHTPRRQMSTSCFTPSSFRWGCAEPAVVECLRALTRTPRRPHPWLGVECGRPTAWHPPDWATNLATSKRPAC